MKGGDRSDLMIAGWNEVCSWSVDGTARSEGLMGVRVSLVIDWDPWKGGCIALDDARMRLI